MEVGADRIVDETLGLLLVHVACLVLEDHILIPPPLDGRRCVLREQWVSLEDRLLCVLRLTLFLFLLLRASMRDTKEAG